MKDLPALYAAVCAKRPELAASVIYSNIIDVHDGGLPIWGWFWQVSDGMGVHVHHSIAAAMILARWVEALPVGNGLYHAENYENGETRWWIGPNASMPTPIEALAAFWLQQ